MEQTSSLSERVLKAAGFLPAVVLASTSLAVAPLSSEGAVLVSRGVLQSPTVSRPERLIGEARSWTETKAARVRALRGKYRDALTPSDEFAKQKAQEIALEG